MALNFQKVTVFSGDCKDGRVFTDRRSFGTLDKAIERAHEYRSALHVDIIDKRTKEVVWSWDANEQ